MEKAVYDTNELIDFLKEQACYRNRFSKKKPHSETKCNGAPDGFGHGSATRRGLIINRPPSNCALASIKICS